MNPSTDAASLYREECRSSWENIARQLAAGGSTGGYYHRRLASVYRFLVPPGQRVLELGSGPGRLLASVRPSFGVGIDFTPKMVELARSRHPELEFVCGDVHDLSLSLDGPFDTVILSDLIHDVWDLQAVFDAVRPQLTPRARVVLNYSSRLWEPALVVASRFGRARPVRKRNWFTPSDVSNLLHISGFDTLRAWQEILLPLPVPGLAGLANRFLVKLWPFRHLGLTNFVVARPTPEPVPPPKVSVVVAARNEAGNISSIIDRTPEIAAGTELIFVEGGSSDGTFETIEATIPSHPDRDIRLYRQPGTGKGDAVRHGFSHASGDVLLILDADLTVPPEDLPRFVDALVTGKGEFVNGVRLVYPMEDRAMRFLNMLGNKFFSAAFSWLLGQPVKDTLCGTKVLWREDFLKIAANRSYFGTIDPYGDFDLLFGAAKLNLKIVDLPIRYRERIYGETNIDRWSGGWLLLRMVGRAARRLKFV